MGETEESRFQAAILRSLAEIAPRDVATELRLAELDALRADQQDGELAELILEVWMEAMQSGDRPTARRAYRDLLCLLDAHRGGRSISATPKTSIEYTRATREATEHHTDPSCPAVREPEAECRCPKPAFLVHCAQCLGVLANDCDCGAAADSWGMRRHTRTCAVSRRCDCAGGAFS